VGGALGDAQARASARLIASSDAAVTAWVRALMRDLRHRDDAVGPTTDVAPREHRGMLAGETGDGSGVTG
jgi:hypothetical protein